MAISGLSYVNSSSSDSSSTTYYLEGPHSDVYWIESHPGYSTSCWAPLIIERKEVKEEMRGLFYVAIVDYLNDTVLEDGLYIAKDAETAKIKALSVFADTYDLDDLDVICQRLGDIRKKKEIQEVKIVKE